MGKGLIVAATDIHAGEEVTFDYSTNVGWVPYEMTCSCGSEGCRGVVLSYDHLSDELKRKYGTNISAYLLMYTLPLVYFLGDFGLAVRKQILVERGVIKTAKMKQPASGLSARAWKQLEETLSWVERHLNDDLGVPALHPTG